jgi:hypothetical protein
MPKADFCWTRMWPIALPRMASLSRSWSRAPMPGVRPLGDFRRSKQIARAYAKGGGNLVERNNSWVSAPLFETADVLLAESRDISKLLLG